MAVLVQVMMLSALAWSNGTPFMSRGATCSRECEQTRHPLVRAHACDQGVPTPRPPWWGKYISYRLHLLGEALTSPRLCSAISPLARSIDRL